MHEMAQSHNASVFHSSQYANVCPLLCIWWFCVLLECCCRARRLARLHLKPICIEKHTEVLPPLSKLTWIDVLHWKITCCDLHVNPPSGRALSVHQAAVSERVAHRKLRPIARGPIADCSVVGKTLQAKRRCFFGTLLGVSPSKCS